MTLQKVFQDLVGMGFFEYADEDGKRRALEVFEEHEIVFSDYTGRVFDADSEDLAEGEVQEFIESRIGPFLAGQGVDLQNVELEQDISEVGYSLFLHGNEIVLYSEEELESDEFWQLCTERAFRFVNSLLQRAGSEERLYYLYGGNDAQAVFLTPEIFRLISESDALPESEKPVDVGVFGT